MAIAALEGQVEAMLAEAETVDAAEDARLGPDRREEDVPAELARRETRLGKLQAARASLEAQAREKARVKAEQSERRGAQRRDESPDEQRIADVGQAAADTARPEATAQRNFTDPDSRIMQNGDGAFIQAYNGPAVVDDTDQIAAAAAVTSCASDVPSLSPMLDQAVGNTGRAPRQALVDAGYCSEGNLTAAAQRHADGGTDTLIAVGRLKPRQTPPRPWPPSGLMVTRPRGSGWRAGCAPRPAERTTPAAKRLLSPSLVRSAPAKTANDSFFGARTGPAGSGGCSWAATTFTSSSRRSGA